LDEVDESATGSLNLLMLATASQAHARFARVRLLCFPRSQVGLALGQPPFGV
jgi:hypothetical protein